MKIYKSLIAASLLTTTFLNASDFVIDMREHTPNNADINKQVHKQVIKSKIDSENDRLIYTKDNIKLKEKKRIHSSDVVVNTRNKKLSKILRELNLITHKNYILKGKDIFITRGYKINTADELKEVIHLESDYELLITKSNIQDTIIVKCRKNVTSKQINIETRVNWDRLTDILNMEYNIQLIVPAKIIKNDIDVKLLGSYTYAEFIKTLQTKTNLWFNLEGNKLYVSPTKNISFDIRRNGKLNMKFNDELSDTGFKYSLKDINKEDFINELNNNFPNIKFLSARNGSVTAIIQPNDLEKLTNYFQKLEDNFVPITGQLYILSFIKNNNSINLKDLLISKNLISNSGQNGTLFLNYSNKSPNFINTIESYGKVSIVDKWTISTATGIPTGFTNYKKTPYTVRIGEDNEKIKYVNTGFKTNFSINKTSHDTFIIDGAINYSNIYKWTTTDEGSIIPTVNGKDMRIFGEFKSLDSGIVIGGFKNVTENHSQSTNFFSHIPFISWLFNDEYKNNENTNEKEYIVFIKLNKPENISKYMEQSKTIKNTVKKSDKVIDYKIRKNKRIKLDKNFEAFSEKE